RGRHCGRCPQASVQAALRAGPTPPARLYVHVFDQVDAPTEPLRRDVEVIGFGIERFVQMIPLFFQDGVRQQWTASARALMREIDPQAGRVRPPARVGGARVDRQGNPAGDVKPGRAVALACLVAVSLVACDRLADRQVEQALTRTRTDLLKSPDLHVVLCGTGTPLPDPARAGACTAIIAGGELVLVDV